MACLKGSETAPVLNPALRAGRDREGQSVARVVYLRPPRNGHPSRFRDDVGTPREYPP